MLDLLFKKREHFLIFSLGLIAFVFFVAIYIYGIATLMKKFLGVLLALFGGFMVIRFPRYGESDQPEQFAILGILLGLFSFFLGIYFIFF